MTGINYSQLPLFTGLSRPELDHLRGLFIPFDCYADELLFEQGDPAEYLYLVLTGEVKICYKPEDGPPILVTTVREGGVVGWSAALGSQAYTSGAMCGTYCQMLRVRGEDLSRLCQEHPETGQVLLERLASIIAKRLRNTHNQVIELLEHGLRNGNYSLKEVGNGG